MSQDYEYMVESDASGERWPFVSTRNLMEARRSFRDAMRASDRLGCGKTILSRRPIASPQVDTLQAPTGPWEIIEQFEPEPRPT